MQHEAQPCRYADSVISPCGLVLTWSFFQDGSRTVYQFHFTSWPDHGVPQIATALLNFRKKVRSYDYQATGPPIVHCRWGRVYNDDRGIAINDLEGRGRLKNILPSWHGCFLHFYFQRSPLFFLPWRRLLNFFPWRRCFIFFLWRSSSNFISLDFLSPIINGQALRDMQFLGGQKFICKFISGFFVLSTNIRLTKMRSKLNKSVGQNNGYLLTF